MEALPTQRESVLAEVQAYNEKPNKSISKRIRTKLGSIKKDITGIRATLVKADADGYK